jgi:hypothetical protein
MKKRYLGLILATSLVFCGFSCQGGTQKLAVASDAVAHGLANAETAEKQAVASGVISAADGADFEVYVSKVAQAGQVLDQGIRANESATSVSGKVNSFLDAFNALNTSGLAGIKDPNTKLAISTIITGVESSVAVIAATVGGK